MRTKMEPPVERAHLALSSAWREGEKQEEPNWKMTKAERIKFKTKHLHLLQVQTLLPTRLLLLDNPRHHSLARCTSHEETHFQNWHCTFIFVSKGRLKKNFTFSGPQNLPWASAPAPLIHLIPPNTASFLWAADFLFLTTHSFLAFNSGSATWLQPFPLTYKTGWPLFWLSPGHLPFVCSLDIGHDCIPWKSLFVPPPILLTSMDTWLLPLCQSS